MGKPALAGNAARLRKPQTVAGTATALTIERADGRHGTLPQIVVLRGFNQLYTGIRAVAAQLAKPTVVLLCGLDIGIGPTDGGLEPFLAKQAHRFERARSAACMQQ